MCILSQGDTALSSPAVSDHTGSALRQFGDPDFCRNPASQPLSLPAVSIADQSTKPGNDQLRDQPSQNPFTSSPLEYASGSSLQSADVQIQASVPEHAFEALATVKCSRAAAQSAVPHASGCGLQDLPPEVLMHILASLPLQVLLSGHKSSSKPFDTWRCRLDMEILCLRTASIYWSLSSESNRTQASQRQIS